jgi:aminoglycoside phosphotransferase (APT) family kinase protein
MSIEQPLARGQTAEIFAHGNQHVLKLFLRGRPAGKARYEALISHAVYASGVPAPAVYAVVERDGRRGVVYERVSGASMEHALTSRPWRLPELADQLASVHAAIHAYALPGLPELRAQLERRINSATPLPTGLRQAALAALEGLPGGAALCHGDFHPGNLLLSSRGPLVIDWENASCGHPHADVARTLLLIRMGHLYTPPGAYRLATLLFLRLFATRYLRAYTRLTGAQPAQIARWQLPLAAARLSEGVATEERGLLELVQRMIARA